MDDLSDEQQAVMEDLYAGKSMLITGAAGTGKSHLMRHMTDSLNRRGILYGVCGSTGVSAVNVGGTTIHSWAGIGYGEGHVSTLVQNIRNNKNAFRRITKSDVLCLDEISMISGELFTKLDGVFRMVREEDVPFGGMQMVFFGDMLQLPPVNGGYAFDSPSWDKLGVKIHYLTKVFRQKDLAFSTALGMLRIGMMDQCTKNFFNARFKAVDENPEILPVTIVAKNETADRINRENLDKLEGEMITYNAIDKGNDKALRLLEKSLIPKTLELKVGARVICLINMADISVMNGTAGVVTGFSYGSPIVRFDNGEELPMDEYEREITEDGKVIGSRTQIPLRLAWAISSHKSQGTTLDKVRVIMGDAWEKGQCYVALSRVRTPEGLFIESLNSKALSPDPRALAFYEKHRKLDRYDNDDLI
jgi:ATP-dependent DNA helicase PIF1